MADREVALSAGTTPRRARVREFVANRSGTQRVGAIAAVLVLLTAPFGGWRSADEADTEPLRIGQKIDIGPFYVTVDSVRQLRELPPVLEEDPTSRIFSIKVTVTNHTDRPQNAKQVTDAFGGSDTGFLAWTEGGPIEPQVYDVDDAGEVDSGDFVNPGLTYHWALVLRQRPDADLDAITLRIYGYDFVAEDVQTLDPNRWDIDLDQPLVEGHVPVEVVP